MPDLKGERENEELCVTQGSYVTECLCERQRERERVRDCVYDSA